MKKLLILCVAMFLAAALPSLAQSADKDAPKTSSQPEKGGTYAAPVQVQKTQVPQVSQTPAGGTSSVNPGVVSKELPDDFPKFVDTGNPEQDQANYDKAKQEWIARNPEKYLEMQQSQPQSK